MKEQVEKALDKVRGFLRMEGGDVELVDIVEGVVKVRLKGMCSCCPMSMITLKDGVERIVKEEVPEVKSVEQVC
ncbi:MAG: NifU family protein [Atribacterota bacterium]|nr:NifU family protein [Candidatus Atribacteria bacterium]